METSIFWIGWQWYWCRISKTHGFIFFMNASKEFRELESNNGFLVIHVLKCTILSVELKWIVDWKFACRRYWYIPDRLFIFPFCIEWICMAYERKFEHWSCIPYNSLYSSGCRLMATSLACRLGLSFLKYQIGRRSEIVIWITESTLPDWWQAGLLVSYVGKAMSVTYLLFWKYFWTKWLPLNLTLSVKTSLNYSSFSVEMPCQPCPLFFLLHTGNLRLL